MSTYQKYIYPINRIDGYTTIENNTILPTNPNFITLNISSQNLGINGISYNWPTDTAEPNTYLTTDGSGNLSWQSILGIGTSNKIQDIDGDTSVDVDMLGTGSDDTIRYKANGINVQTITKETTVIKTSLTATNKFTIEEYNSVPFLGHLAVVRNNYLITLNTFQNPSYIQIYDITNFNTYNPVLISSTSTVNTSTSAPKFYGKYIIFGDFNLNSIRIYDISTPFAPVLISSYSSTYVDSLVVLGNSLYFSDSRLPEILRCVNISDPTNQLTLTASLTLSSLLTAHATSLIVKDNVLYAVYKYINNNVVIMSFDIRNSANIFILDTLFLNSTTDSIIFENTIIHGNYIFTAVASDQDSLLPNGIMSIDISDPLNMSIADTNYPITSVNAYEEIRIINNIAHIMYDDLLGTILTLTFNISDPTNIVYLGSIAAIPNYYGIGGVFKDVIIGYDANTYFDHIQSSYIQRADASSIKTYQLDVDGNIICSKDAIVSGSAIFEYGFNIIGNMSIWATIEISNIFQVNGQSIYPVQSTSSTSVDLDRDYVINMSNLTSAIINLPSINSSRYGAKFIINKVTTALVTVNAFGPDLIWDGSSEASSKNLVSTNPNTSFELFCNGTKWFLE